MSKALVGWCVGGAAIAWGCAGAQLPPSTTRATSTAASPAPVADALAQDRQLFESEMARGNAMKPEQPADAMAAFGAARAAAQRHPEEMWASFAEASLALAVIMGEDRPGPAAAVLEPALEWADERLEREPDAKRVYQRLDAKYAELREREWRAEQAHRLEVYGGVAREVNAAGTLRSITPQEALLPPVLPKSADPRAGVVSGARETAATLREDFQRCYEQALEKAPEAHGEVWVKIEVGAGGAVSRASAVGRGLSENTLDCMLRHISLTRFGEPVGGRGALTIPITFFKS